MKTKIRVIGDYPKHAEFFACREDKIQELIDAEAAVRAHSAGVVLTPSTGKKVEEEEKETSYIWQKAGNIAVVEIKGKLTNEDSRYNRYYGLLSYNEIRRAYAEILEDPDIEMILEDYGTPGGRVLDMTETEEVMAQVGRVKPRAAYVGSMSASAGYYLMMRADRILASKMGEAGSIGVLQVVMDFTKMMDDIGISAEILRSGDLKAVGGPMEKLSDESRQYLLDQVKYVADIFFSSVATNRSIGLEELEALGIKTGKTFIGAQAVAARLVDGIASFDSLLYQLQKQSESVKQAPNSLIKYSQGVDMKKKLISQAALAAMASGVTVSAGEAGDDSSLAPETPTATGTENVVGDEGTPAEGQVAEDQTGDGQGDAAEPTQAGDPTVTLLREQLKEERAATKDAEKALVKAEEKVEKLTADLETAQTAATAMSGIVAAAINTMQIGLGHSAETLSGLSAETLVERYNAVKADFEKAFVVGGHTSGASASENENKVQLDSSQAAAHRSVGLN